MSIETSECFPLHNHRCTLALVEQQGSLSTSQGLGSKVESTVAALAHTHGMVSVGLGGKALNLWSSRVITWPRYQITDFHPAHRIHEVVSGTNRIVNCYCFSTVAAVAAGAGEQGHHPSVHLSSCPFISSSSSRAAPRRPLRVGRGLPVRFCRRQRCQRPQRAVHGGVPGLLPAPVRLFEFPGG